MELQFDGASQQSSECQLNTAAVNLQLMHGFLPREACSCDLLNGLFRKGLGL